MPRYMFTGGEKTQKTEERGRGNSSKATSLIQTRSRGKGSGSEDDVVFEQTPRYELEHER